MAIRLGRQRASAPPPGSVGSEISCDAVTKKQSIYSAGSGLKGAVHSSFNVNGHLIAVCNKKEAVVRLTDVWKLVLSFGALLLSCRSFVSLTVASRSKWPGDLIQE